MNNNDHIQGNKNAKILLVVYSDLQCPYCARFHETTKEFLAKYKDVALVFRHLPLDFHQYATERAKASECAAKLGGADKFWTFVDSVFAASDLNNVDMTQTANALGLNAGSFKSCLDGKDFDSRISEVRDGGIKYLSATSSGGGYGTPGAVIINKDKKVGEKLAGAVPLADLEAAYNKVK